MYVVDHNLIVSQDPPVQSFVKLKPWVKVEATVLVCI